MNLPHLAARLFDTPLMIHRPKLDVILRVLGPRLGLQTGEPASFTPPTRTRPAGPSTVQVLPIYGTLVRRTLGLDALSGLTSYEAIAADLDAAAEDTRVSAILLDIDSPGGEAAGVFDLADRIRAAAQIKPVWAMANDMACSAAYALGSAASRLYLSRTGCVGSIGVIAMHADQSLHDAQQGMRYTTVFAGERKNDLNPHEPISDEALASLKAEVNRLYDLFVETVAANRQLSVDDVRQTEAGLFYGADAVEHGLADAVGTLDMALAHLTETLHNPETQPLTRAAFFTSSIPKLEHPMPGTEPADSNTPNPHPDPKPATEPVVTPPQPTDAAGLTADEAQEVAELCQIAGCPERIAPYLVARTKPAVVRNELLGQRASSPELTSHLNPNPNPAATHTQSLETNPVILAARARASKEK